MNNTFIYMISVYQYIIGAIISKNSNDYPLNIIT